jgi:hypothetical protein
MSPAPDFDTAAFNDATRRRPRSSIRQTPRSPSGSVRRRAAAYRPPTIRRPECTPPSRTEGNGPARERRRASPQIADLEEGDRLHAVLPGNFVFAEILTQLAERMKPQSVSIATLSLSRQNADALAAALDAGHIGELSFLISDKAIMKHMEQAAQHRRWRIGSKRSHAKVATLDTHIVLETSANLRSSQNIEQLSAFNDTQLHAFHTQWITELMP